MTAKELQQRNEKADHLRVLQTDDGQYFVESGEGKILYNVNVSDDGDTCTCGDFAKNIKRDPDFRCKHILAVFNAVPKREVEGAVFLEKQVPRLDERWITKIEGKEFVKYPGLLDLAHQHGISSIKVDIVQMPTADNGNFAVCRATVMSKIGETYTDIGDANPNNCSSKVSKHLLRMASNHPAPRPRGLVVAKGSLRQVFTHSFRRVPDTDHNGRPNFLLQTKGRHGLIHAPIDPNVGFFGLKQILAIVHI